MRSKYFKTFCEQTFDTSPTDANSSSSFELMIVKTTNCCVEWFAKFATSFSIHETKVTVFSVAPASSCKFNNIFAVLHLN